MPAHAKICGLSDKESVNVAIADGASYLGFVFFEGSPRCVTPELAKRLSGGAAARGIKTVAVVVDPDDAALEALFAAFRPDFVQLHGAEPPGRVLQIRARTGASIIKAVRVADARDVTEGLSAFDGTADHILFDAAPAKGARLPGGNGAAFDWGLLADIRPERPWFLAGGLDPWNVAEALQLTRAPLVDVSSGVERGPGIKNPALISAFLSAAKKA
jgi:phosphoribosylanthranilate isomerase